MTQTNREFESQFWFLSAVSVVIIAMDLHENCECVMIGVDSTYIVPFCGPIPFAMPNTTTEPHLEWWDPKCCRLVFSYVAGNIMWMTGIRAFGLLAVTMIVVVLLIIIVIIIMNIVIRVIIFSLM